MKLKNYFSTKNLRRKLSKFNINESQCKINDSFSDYNDNQTGPIEAISKDDMYLRPKKEGRYIVRADMTKSFTGHLPSAYQSTDMQTDSALPSASSMRDYGSQTYLPLSVSHDNCVQSINSSSANPLLCSYKDNINCMELSSHSVQRVELSTPTRKVCTCVERSTSECCHYDTGTSYSSWQYQSLPSNQTTNNIIQDIHYNSLPSSMTQSIYIPSDSVSAMSHPLQPPQNCVDTWRRSRIKTNPWLPLPKENNNDTLRRRRVNKRAEPRLSRFISEVEEMMREQLCTSAYDTLDATAVCGGYKNGSNESLASTCSTATEIPERKLDNVDDAYATMGSPSEGYKSACCSISSDLNLADTESFSDSRSSSNSDLTNCSELGLTSSRCVSGGRCPPSLQDFTASLNSDSNNWTSSNSLLSESMFASAHSPKYEALEVKLRRLCQSTTDLDEKMRLARIECSYIKSK